MRFPRPSGYLGEVFDFVGQTFTALSQDFKKFRLAFVLSLLPAAAILVIALCLGANARAPWLGTALAIAVWLPVGVTLFGGVGGLFGAFWMGDLGRLQSFAAMIAGSLVFAIATRYLPHKHWAIAFLMLVALLLLAFAGGTGKLRWWIFILLAVECALLFVPVVFPDFGFWVDSTGNRLNQKMLQSVSKPMAINWNHPPTPFDPATGKSMFYYTQRPDGTYAIFDHSGFSQYDGSRLKPITTLAKWKEIVTFMRMRQQLKGMVKPTETAPPSQSAPAPPQVVLADPEPLNITTYHAAMTLDLTPPGGLWYTVDAGGTYRFFSSFGLDPVTKKPVKLITGPIAVKIRRYFKTLHWPHGPDHISLRRMSESQALHIDFFPQGGLWCDHGGRFGYRIFDGPGRDPKTGQTLRRLSPAVARQLRQTFRAAIWPAAAQ